MNCNCNNGGLGSNIGNGPFGFNISCGNLPPVPEFEFIQCPCNLNETTPLGAGVLQGNEISVEAAQLASLNFTPDMKRTKLVHKDACESAERTKKARSFEMSNQTFNMFG